MFLVNYFVNNVFGNKKKKRVYNHFGEIHFSEQGAYVKFVQIDTLPSYFNILCIDARLYTVESFFRKSIKILFNILTNLTYSAFNIA